MINNNISWGIRTSTIIRNINGDKEATGCNCVILLTKLSTGSVKMLKRKSIYKAAKAKYVRKLMFR